MVLDTLDVYTHDMLTGNSGSLKVLRPSSYSIFAMATPAIATSVQVGVEYAYNGVQYAIGSMGAPYPWASSTVSVLHNITDITKALDVYAFTSVVMTNGMFGSISVTEVPSW